MGSTMNVDYFVPLIRHWQISSRVARLLCSAKALRTPADRLAEANAELARLLHDWYKCLPDCFQVKSNGTAGSSVPGVRLGHLLHLHTSFHGSVMASHAIFTYPWVTHFLKEKTRLDFEVQESKSTIAVAESARAILRIIQFTEINANTPHWRVMPESRGARCHKTNGLILGCRSLTR